MSATRTLSVRLQSDVVYVTGTVNDVPTTWTRGDGNPCSSSDETSNCPVHALRELRATLTADRAADDVYRVELELINSAGRTYTASFALYYGLLNLITDRTQADVDCVRQLAAKGWAAMTAEERAAWKGGLKGAYNASDLNRVGSAVEYVANRLREAGYIVTVHPRTGWTEEELPIAQRMYAYLSDVKAIRGVLPLPELPTLPEDMSRLTYIGANAIEQVLRLTSTPRSTASARGAMRVSLYANEQ